MTGRLNITEGGSCAMSKTKAVQKTPAGALIRADPLFITPAPRFESTKTPKAPPVPKFQVAFTAMVAVAVGPALPSLLNSDTVTVAAAAPPLVHENTVAMPLLITPGTDQMLLVS